MTISELYDKTGRMLARIDTEIEAQASKAGADIVALVTNRVVQTGNSSDGGSFTPYSTAPHSAHLYYNKSRSGSAEAKVRAKGKKKEKISYRDFREINNLNPAPKNFEFTGAMWRGFSVLSVRRSATGVTVVIGGGNEDSADKMTQNSKRENKSIIRPSRQELAIVQGNLQRWVNGILNG